MEQRKRGKASIRRTVLISYGLLLCLVLAVMTCTAWFTIRQLNGERRVYHASVVESCREITDTGIVNAEKLINRLVYLDAVKKLAHDPGGDAHHVYYNMYSECQALYQLYGTYVSDFFIYDSRSDMVFSVYGVSSRENFFSEQNTLFTKWYNAYFQDSLCIDDQTGMSTALISPVDHQPYLLVTDAIPIVCTDNEYLNIGLVIPVGSFTAAENYSVGLYMSEKNPYIMPDADGERQQGLSALFASARYENGMLSVQQSGGTIYRIQSRYFDFAYVVELPDSYYDGAVGTFLIRFAAVGFVFLAAACLITYLMIRHIYTSSADLMHRIFSDDGIAVDTDSNNEFDILDEYIRKKTAQHKSNLQHSVEHSRNYLISCLLRGKDIRQFENTLYRWEDVLGFPFETSQFVAIRIVPSVEPLEASVAPQLQHIQEFIQPAVSDLFVDQYHVFFCEADSSLACLLSPVQPMDISNFMFDVKTKLEYFSAFSEEQMCHLVIVVGSAVSGASSIKKSWTDTIYMMELLAETPGVFMCTEPPAIHYDAAAAPKAEALRRLGLSLCAADLKRSNEIITSLLADAIARCAPNYALRILFYDILQTLMSCAAAELSDQKRVEQFAQNHFPIYVVRKDFNAMLGFLSELCCIIVAQIKERDALRSTEPEKQVSAVRHYVLAHLEEESLCVASIAEYFNMSPPTLSKLFSSVAGGGLHVFINKQRIERAKQLLASEPDISASQVAARCGFSNLRTFSRVFSIETGISPGKYKKEHE